MALNKPDSADSSAIKGFIKASIAVQGPGDSSVRLVDATSTSEANESVMMPASIRKAQKQVNISILKAEKLPKMDTFGGIDAFFQTKWKKKWLKTRQVNQKNEICTFNQTFCLPVEWPLSVDKLKFNIMDWDQVQDETVGTIQMSLKEIVSKYSNPGG